MILIATDKYDLSTNDVIDWLHFYKADYQRINFNDDGEVDLDLSFENDTWKFDFECSNRVIDLAKVDSYWYRKGGLKPIFPDKTMPVEFDNNEVKKKVYAHLKYEIKYLYDFAHKLLDKTPVRIGSHEKVDVNKLDVLHLATSCGLSVPKTTVCSTKEKLISFVEKCEEGVITKAIWESLSVGDDRSGYWTYTNKLDKNFMRKIPDTFFPSLFQEAIAKEFELRIFYLFEEFYPMAIFSQNDSQTEVDFRRYNNEKPNRYIPYNLPADVKEKLIKLMRGLDLVSGSIDMIVDTKGEYYFLEVNPVGQFGMTSVPCNYMIEKKIAKILMNEKQEVFKNN